eukprot:Selendium_serpulae@DN5909_c0_g1_i3.p1
MDDGPTPSPSPVPQDNIADVIPDSFLRANRISEPLSPRVRPNHAGRDENTSSVSNVPASFVAHTSDGLSPQRLTSGGDHTAVGALTHHAQPVVLMGDGSGIYSDSSMLQFGATPTRDLSTASVELTEDVTFVSSGPGATGCGLGQ